MIFSSAYTPIKAKQSGFGDLIMLVIVGVIIYAVYRSCLSTNENRRSYEEDDIPSQGFGTRHSSQSRSYPNDYGQHNTGGKCFHKVIMFSQTEKTIYFYVKCFLTGFI